MSRQAIHIKNIEKIKSRRIDFKKRNNSNLIERIKELRQEVVRASFSHKMDLKRHRLLLIELNKVNDELKYSI